MIIHTGPYILICGQFLASDAWEANRRAPPSRQPAHFRRRDPRARQSPASQSLLTRAHVSTHLSEPAAARSACCISLSTNPQRTRPTPQRENRHNHEAVVIEMNMPTSRSPLRIYCGQIGIAWMRLGFLTSAALAHRSPQADTCGLKRAAKSSGPRGGTKADLWPPNREVRRSLFESVPTWGVCTSTLSGVRAQ
jgi:hypothetical protein